MGYGSRFPTIFVAIAAVVTAVLVMPVLVLLFFSKYSYFPYCGGPGFMLGFMGFPLLMMFPIGAVVLGAIAYVAYRGFSWSGYCAEPLDHHGNCGAGEGKETPMEILGRRYSKGEITKEQFEQRVPVLNVLTELEKQGEVSSEEVKEEASKD